MKKQFLGLLILFASFSHAQENICTESPFGFLLKHPTVFEKGKFLVFRQEDAWENVLYMRQKEPLSNDNLLALNGFSEGDRIIEICGVMVQDFFKASKENPVCCNNGYPEKISVAIKKKDGKYQEIYVKP